MKYSIVFATLIASMFMSASAMAWDCSYWSQSQDPNGECYQPPLMLQQSNVIENKNIAKSSASSTASANNNGNLSNVGNASATGNGSNNSTSASASADGAGANSNNTTIESNYKAAKIPVNTAYSAGLTSGMDTCLGSISGGIQTGIIGATFGKTKVDDNCVIIKRIHVISEFSVTAGCDYMLEHIPDAAASFAAVGVTCVPRTAPPVIVPAPGDFVTHEELIEHEKRITTKLVTK